MILNKKELKEVQYDFNSNTNRLLQADFSEYTSELKKYIRFLRNTEIIYSYISDCGEPDYDPETEVKEMRQSYGHIIFSTGDTDEEEVRNVFSVLAYIADNNIEIYDAVTFAYCHGSRHFQDGIKGFNERFVMILVRHIDKYLTKLGIEMGLDENAKYIISVDKGMVNVASENATINADNIVNSPIDEKKLAELLDQVRQTSPTVNPEEIEKINESLEVIKDELAKAQPKKTVVKLALGVLQGIKGSTEFLAAVATLATYVFPLIP
jgi:F0F1-type ATP synthase epsilon subunit